MEAPTGKSTDPILQDQMPGPVGGELTDTDFALLDGLTVVDEARLSTDTGFGPARRRLSHARNHGRVQSGLRNGDSGCVPG